MASCEIEREKFYPGPGIQPGSLALRASVLQLCYPGQLPIQGRIMPGFSNMRYRFYSNIDRVTAVLELHERKIAHRFDKCLLT